MAKKRRSRVTRHLDGERMPKKYNKEYRDAVKELKEELKPNDFVFKTKSQAISAGVDRNQLFLWYSRFQAKRLGLRWGSHKALKNELRYQQFSDAFMKVVDMNGGKFDSMLEVGSGHGHWLYYWKKYANTVYALDHSYAMLEESMKVLPNLTYIQGDCWKLPFKKNQVDFVFMIDVTMHIGGSWKAIAEMMRVSKKYVMFTGPSWKPEKWQKRTKHGATLSFQFKKKQSDMQIGKISWAVNQDFIEARLNYFMRKGRIKRFWYEPRKSTSAYNHKILMIEM